MTQQAYTEGPWAIRDTNDHGDLYVAQADSYDWIAIITQGPLTKRETHEANARLIAAAPALLEALVEARDHFDEPRDNCPDCGSDEMCAFHAVLTDMDAAIALATGTSDEGAGS